MPVPTPVDQDAVNPNILTLIRNLQTRIETLERQAASGLFDGDTMQPPGPVSVQGGNFEIIGNRSIHRAIVGLGPAVILTINGGEITAAQTYLKIAAETGTTDDLDTINGGIDGDMLWLVADTGDTITITEADNILVSGTVDTLEDDNWALAIYNGDTGIWLMAQAV